MRIYIPERNIKNISLGFSTAEKVLSLFLEPLKKKDVIVSIIEKMDNEFKNVLVGRKSALTKTHTYIQNFPDGKENGIFLGVHFDSGIINVAGMTVDGLTTLNSLCETIVVPEEERLLRGTERVMFVAKCLKNFSRRMKAVEYPDLGSVWNVGVNRGYLKEEGRVGGLKSLHSQSWPDEYNFTGKPVRIRSFRQKIVAAADSLGFNLDIKGFIHTPEAVFLHSIWKYPNAIGALSLSHRCVTCFMAQTSKVKKVSHKDDDLPFILLKIFWETFGNEGEMDALLNDFDWELARQTEESSKAVFKYIVSEEYIIKLVRLVLLTLSEEGIIFQSNDSNKAKIKDYLQEETHTLSSMARSYSRGMGDHIKRTFHFDSLQVNETLIINRVIEVISWRASLMIGILITIYMRNAFTQRDESVFLINGEHSENEIQHIKSAMNYLMTLDETLKNKKISIQHSTWSQVFGAAVLAAIYTKNPFDYDSDFQGV